MDHIESNDKKHLTIIKYYYCKEYWDKHFAWTKQNL